MSEIFYYASPVGTLKLMGTSVGVEGVYFLRNGEDTAQNSSAVPSSLQACVIQLDEYFAGQRQNFDLPLSLHGTDFQKRVWETLAAIPFGQTTAYGTIAQQLGNPKAMRAVGAANGKNPISIILPCHRVIGSNGKLTGYGGGLWRKEWLLAHESKVLGQAQQLSF